MPVRDLYTKRLRRMVAGDPDVFSYDVIPSALRIQVLHIWSDVTGINYHAQVHNIASYTREFFSELSRILCAEYGKLQLIATLHYSQVHQQCQIFLMQCTTEQALDVIEVSFQLLSRRHSYANKAVAAIDELNQRFREHGVGYQFVDDQIIRVDSQYAHSEIILPALALLHQGGFEGASEEFLKAHEHYRHGRNKEAITEANKAFESTLKTICSERGWLHSPNANVNTLIDVVIANGLVPEYLTTHMKGLRSALDSGLPTLRNRDGAHGQGVKPIQMPNSLAAFALHLAASNIVFLVERHNELG